MAPPRVSLLLAALFFGLSQCSVAAISKVSPDDWAVLNASVSGRLFSLRPMAFPCYTSYNGEAKLADQTACAEVHAKKTSDQYIISQAGGLVQGNWGICQASNIGCPISPSSAPDGGIIEGNCAQGSVADYYIDVQEASHIEEALQFANKHGIQVVIKNTGLDHAGRSTAPNALVLWTHNFQPPLKLTKHFVLEGCKDPVGKVVTFGAGQQWDGIYKFAEANHVTVVGSSLATIGAAGGWITGGGHGMLSPAFGLGVDNVQQFRVVLPNGTFVTANRCQNPDVFFALRGGGGGTFGVIVEMSTTAYQQLTLQSVKVQLPRLSQIQSRELLKVLVANANRWAAEGWGGESYFMTEHSIQLVNPFLNAHAAATSMKPLLDFARANQGSVFKTTYPSWYQFYKANIAGSYDSASSWGNAISSRLIPASNFEGVSNQDELVDALMASVETEVAGGSIVPLLRMVTPARTADAGSALTPAWRQATWQLVLMTQWDPAATTAAATRAAFAAVHRALDPVRRLTPDAGVYLNEADVLEAADAPDLFWGADNYQRLLRIKAELDPNNILQVHAGVGSDPKADMFACYPKGPKTVIGSQDEL